MNFRETLAANTLTLVFENGGGEWLMVQDQNTPIKG
jgi:hypothetical protein